MKIMAKEIFREIRLKKGFTTVMLAEKAGVTKQMIAMVERRECGIGPEKANIILKTLKLEFDDVFELVDRG